MAGTSGCLKICPHASSMIARRGSDEFLNQSPKLLPANSPFRRVGGPPPPASIVRPRPRNSIPQEVPSEAFDQTSGGQSSNPKNSLVLTKSYWSQLKAVAWTSECSFSYPNSLIHPRDTANTPWPDFQQSASIDVETPIKDSSRG